MRLQPKTNTLLSVNYLFSQSEAGKGRLAAAKPFKGPTCAPLLMPIGYAAPP
jgi:hypothetical protein